MIQDIMRELYCIKLLVHSWHPQLSYPFRKEKKKKKILFGGSKFAGITTMLTMLRLGESAQQK